jgi:tRNA (cytidine/uridine-2'-O-)-methyltransferase
MVRIALYQPEIPQNTGTLMRLCACLSIHLDVIHPCGFLWDDRRLKRAGMDYMDIACVQHHTNWEDFYNWACDKGHRIILLDTQAEIIYTDFSFQHGDILLMGRESTGVPKDVFNLLSHRIRIPTAPNCRSLNVSLAASMVVGEGLRQQKTSILP